MKYSVERSCCYLQKNWNLLHQVCCCGDVEIFQWLLETIPGFKTRDKLNQKSVVSTALSILAVMVGLVGFALNLYVGVQD